MLPFLYLTNFAADGVGSGNAPALFTVKRRTPYGRFSIIP